MQNFWDPAGEQVNVQTFERQRAKLIQKLAQLQADPVKLRRTRRLLLFGALSLSALFLFFMYKDHFFNFQFFIYPFIPIGIYSIHIKRLQEDLIGCLVALTHQWIYSPDESTTHWKALAAKFPSLFNKGNWLSQHVENEFWGKVEIDGTTYDFWKAPFVYQVGSGKHSRTVTEDAIAFRLPRAVHGNLLLMPEGLHLFGEGKDDVKTESIEFNNTFVISCPNIDETKKINIIRALSPAVQEKLLDLNKKRGRYSLALNEDNIVFCFQNYISSMRYTNFFTKVEIDPRDTEALQQDFRTLVGVAGDILRYMD